MPLKQFEYLPEIALKDPLNNTQILTDNGDPFIVSFRSFVYKFLSLNKFTETFEALKSAFAIANAVDKSKNGDMIILAEEDWSRLSDSIRENFSIFGFNAPGLIQLMPFFDAVLKAKDV